MQRGLEGINKNLVKLIFGAPIKRREGPWKKY
jgi:hypothetical protein